MDSKYKELAKHTYNQIFIEDYHLFAKDIDSLQKLIYGRLNMLKQDLDRVLFLEELADIIKTEKIDKAMRQKSQYKRVIMANYDEIQALYDWIREQADGSNIANEKETYKDKFQESFENYLHHENKAALMKKLHELLDSKKGRAVAVVIRALTECAFINIKGNKLYRAMEAEFGKIGAHSNINDFLNKEHKLKYNDIKATIEILKTIK